MTDISKLKMVNCQKGSTLIEVVVAVLIFAIGVLGFASLQTRSIQGGFDNNQRDQVVRMSESLIDRVRTNVSNVANYQVALSSFTIGDCAQPATSCAQTTGGGDPGACNAAQIVAFDIWDAVCSNNFQGANVIPALEVDLDCTGVCSAGVNATLSMTWCAKTNEVVLASSGVLNTCDALSQMSYSLDYVP